MKKCSSARILPALSCVAALSLLVLASCSTVSSIADSVAPGDTIIVGQAIIDLRGINLESLGDSPGVTKDVGMSRKIEMTFVDQETGKSIKVFTEGNDGIFMKRVETRGETAYRLVKIEFDVNEAFTKLNVTVGGQYVVKARMGCANVAGKYVVTLAGPKRVNIKVEDDVEFLQEYFKTEFPDSAINDMAWSKD